MKAEIGDYPKGWDDERHIKIEFSKDDMWSLDSTLAIVISRALEEFKKLNTIAIFGVYKEDLPADILEEAEKEETNSCDERVYHLKAMHFILDKMIEAFVLIEEDCATHDPHNNEKIKEGLQLFAKYFRSLWL